MYARILIGLLYTAYAEKEKSHFTGKPDDPLSLGELRTLPVDEQWYSLGQALGMDTEELESIQKTEANVFKCKAQMFRLWLQSDPVVSWEKLATALEDINIQSHHCADIVSSGYVSVESSISSVLSNKDETDGLKHEIQNLVGSELSFFLLVCLFVCLFVNFVVTNLPNMGIECTIKHECCQIRMRLLLGSLCESVT